MLFFLFKQKTAYEMRISDWSSDVCSSDLRSKRRSARFCTVPSARAQVRSARLTSLIVKVSTFSLASAAMPSRAKGKSQGVRMQLWAYWMSMLSTLGRLRSEEHTSELQSLMRISSAVFCLLKNKSSEIH